MWFHPIGYTGYHYLSVLRFKLPHLIQGDLDVNEYITAKKTKCITMNQPIILIIWRFQKYYFHLDEIYVVEDLSITVNLLTHFSLWRSPWKQNYVTFIRMKISIFLQKFETNTDDFIHTWHVYLARHGLALIPVGTDTIHPTVVGISKHMSVKCGMKVFIHS